MTLGMYGLGLHSPVKKQELDFILTKTLLRYAREGEFANEIFLVFESPFTHVLPRNAYGSTESFL